MRWARLSPAIAAGGVRLRRPFGRRCVGGPWSFAGRVRGSKVLLGWCAGLARPRAKGPALGRGLLASGKPTRAWAGTLRLQVLHAGMEAVTRVGACFAHNNFPVTAASW